MRQRISVYFILMLALVALRTGAWGQSLPNPLKIGVGYFGVNYSGDLSKGEGNARFSSGAGVSLQFATTKLISPQLNVGFGKLVGQDRDIPAVEGIQPNTFFVSPFFYVELRIRARFLRESPINPYFGVGIGMLNYSPKDAEGNALIDNLDTRQEGESYGSMTVGFPLTIGTEIKMSDVVSTGIEYVYRPTGSDYLDNVGLLGSVSGKDKLHQLMLSLYITLNP